MNCVLQSVELFEFNRDNVKNDTSCKYLTVPLLRDVLKHSGVGNVLLVPVQALLNKTERVVLVVIDLETFESENVTCNYARVQVNYFNSAYVSL